MRAVNTLYPDVAFEMIKIKTAGDLILDKSLDAIGGKGLFIKELEQALADGRIDAAVHSYKDMPYDETDGLPVVALSARESPFDALVLPEDATEMDNTKPVGSCSLRRTVQFRKLFDGYTVKDVRGNVPTRLSKLDGGEYGALILAQAGLNRLSLQHRASRVFTVDEMIPSGSQGILAVQGRRGEDYFYLSRFHSMESEIVSKAERRYLQTLGGGCSSPVAVYGRLTGGGLSLTGMYVNATGDIAKGCINGAARDATRLGETLAKQLQSRGKVPLHS